MHTRLYRLICQGCNRYSPASLSLSGAITLARAVGWNTSTDHGQPCSQTWCRRCSSSIVEAGA